MAALTQIPLSVIASFPTPNYIDPVTRGAGLVVVNVIFLVLITVCVALRLYTRIAIKRWFGIDDWFIILAYIFTVGTNITVILANERYYWNRHIWDIPLNHASGVLKIVLSATILFTAASSCTRISLLCFYYRLVREAKRPLFRWVLHGSLVYIVAIWITFTFTSLFQCQPLSAFWTLGSKGHCVNIQSLGLAAGIIQTTGDFLVTVIPIPMVMRLKLPRRQRIGVIVLFSLGFIVTAAGIVRTYYISRALFQTYDETWDGYPAWISGAIELDLGLICACAPALRTLFSTYFPNFGSKAGSLIKTVFSREGKVWTVFTRGGTRADESYNPYNSSETDDSNARNNGEWKNWRAAQTNPYISNEEDEEEAAGRVSALSEPMSRIPRAFRASFERGARAMSWSDSSDRTRSITAQKGGHSSDPRRWTAMGEPGRQLDDRAVAETSSLAEDGSIPIMNQATDQYAGAEGGDELSALPGTAVTTEESRAERRARIRAEKKAARERKAHLSFTDLESFDSGGGRDDEGAVSWESHPLGRFEGSTSRLGAASPSGSDTAQRAAPYRHEVRPARLADMQQQSSRGRMGWPTRGKGRSKERVKQDPEEKTREELGMHPLRID